MEIETAVLAQVAVEPQALRETIHREFLSHLTQAEMGLEGAIEWGDIHPHSHANCLSSLREAVNHILAARSEVESDSVPADYVRSN